VRGLGYLRDPEDSRDHPIGALLGGLYDSPPPTSASVQRPEVQPRDQGPTNSCTGQAWSQALRIAFLVAGRPCPELSALHNYFWSRAQWGGERHDGGSFLRTGGKGVIQAGCSTEAAWPFNPELVNHRPSWAADRSGHDFRGVRGYYRIPTGDVDGVRRAIAAGHPVVGGWDVDNAFVNFDGHGAIDAPSGEIVGGHALVIESYSADGLFRLLNSWGSSWGEAGRASVTEAWVGSGSDLWAVAVNP